MASYELAKVYTKQIYDGNAQPISDNVVKAREEL